MTFRGKSLFSFLTVTVVTFAGYYLVSSEAASKTALPSDSDSTKYVESGLPYEGVPKPILPNAQRASASSPCKDCLNEDSALRHFYPCQQHSIKRDDIYRGIEVGENRWIRMACDEAYQSVQDGGGPFGAVIVQVDNDSSQVIRYWRCRNLVTINLDPTAHAEVSAVRTVARELGVFNLGEISKDNPQLKLAQPGATSHCEIYSSCEPCPMCYSAIRWARINTVVFAATRFDAAEPGVDFSDLELFREFETPYRERQHTGLQVYKATTSNSLDAFNLWKNSDKIAY